MSGELSTDVVDDRIRWQRFDVVGEDATERIVIGGAFAVDLARGRLQEGEQIGRAVASIVVV